MASAEEAGAVVAAADGDEVGHGRLGATDFRRDDGAKAGVDDAADALLVAGVQVVASPTVRSLAGGHAAQMAAWCMCRATFGKCSLTCRPGTEVEIGLNFPASLVPGFMSKVSLWRAAVHPQDDARLVPGALPGRVGGQHVEPAGRGGDRDAGRRQLEQIAP